MWIALYVALLLAGLCSLIIACVLLWKRTRRSKGQSSSCCGHSKPSFSSSSKLRWKPINNNDDNDNIDDDDDDSLLLDFHESRLDNDDNLQNAQRLQDNSLDNANVRIIDASSGFGNEFWHESDTQCLLPKDRRSETKIL